MIPINYNFTQPIWREIYPLPQFVSHTRENWGKEKPDHLVEVLFRVITGVIISIYMIRF